MCHLLWGAASQETSNDPQILVPTPCVIAFPDVGWTWWPASNEWNMIKVMSFQIRLPGDCNFRLAFSLCPLLLWGSRRPCCELTYGEAYVTSSWDPKSDSRWGPKVCFSHEGTWKRLLSWLQMRSSTCDTWMTAFWGILSCIWIPDSQKVWDNTLFVLFCFASSH